jgi:hypothetical protein
VKKITLEQLEILLNYEIERSGAQSLDVKLHCKSIKKREEEFLFLKGTVSKYNQRQKKIIEQYYEIEYSYLKRFWTIIAKSYLLYVDDILHRVILDRDYGRFCLILEVILLKF